MPSCFASSSWSAAHLPGGLRACVKLPTMRCSRGQTVGGTWLVFSEDSRVFRALCCDPAAQARDQNNDWPLDDLAHVGA
jgi:hypothetical protein